MSPRWTAGRPDWPLAHAALDPAIAQRIAFLRIALIVGIVVLHIPPSWLLEALPPEALRWPGVIKLFLDYGPLRAGVPALSMISGYLLFLRPYPSYSALIRRKAGTLLVPFLAWNGVVVAMHAVRGQNDLAVLSGSTSDLDGWLAALRVFLDGPPNYPTYFLIDLFILALLSPPLGALLLCAPVPVLVAAALLLLIGLEPVPTVRPDVALPFMVGATVALHRLDPRLLDPYVWPLTAAFLLISIAFIAGLAGGSTSPSPLGLVRAVGAPAVWALSSVLAPTAWGRRLAGWSGFAFVLFCAHSPALHVLAAMWPAWLGYWLFYVSAAPIVIGAVLLAAAILRRWARRVLGLMTGTRTFGRGAAGDEPGKSAGGAYASSGGRMVKQVLKRALGAYYTPRMRHLKRQLEVRFLGKGEPELALLSRVLDPAAVSIDIGANIGDYLGFLARHSRRVVAFEPHPVCFANLQAIGVANCTILNLALSDHAGTAVLTVPVEAEEVTGLATIEPSNRSFAPTATRVQEYEVKVARLDDALPEQLRPGDKVDFIKIDVEGHEHAVIVGATAAIEKHRPIVLLETEYRHGAPIPSIFELFAARGYVARILHVGRMTPVDPTRLRELQRDFAVGDIVKDAQDSDYVNNVWFIPGERKETLSRLGAGD